MTYLTTVDQIPPNDWQKQSRQVIAAGGPGAWTQVRHLLRLRLGKTGLTPDEYYSYALWQRPLSRANLAQFLPRLRRDAYIARLTLPGGRPDAPEIEDKLKTEALLRAANVPVIETRAATGIDETPPWVARLNTLDEITAFLSDPANYPLFLKPVASTFGYGALALSGVSGEALQVLNRGDIPLREVAEELQASENPYLYQPLTEMHPELARHAGQAVPTIRILTLRTSRGPEPQYAVLRLPSKTGMHDGDSLNPRPWAVIDLHTGRLEPARFLGNPGASSPTHWCDPDMPLADLVMPFWAEAKELCIQAHGCYPLNGYLGWDVFLTPIGPIINEVNGNAMPVYQPASGRGILSGAPHALYQDAVAFADAQRGQT